MYLIFALWALYASVSSCLTGGYHPSDREKSVNTQMMSSEKMISKKYNIRPCGRTVAMPEGNIQYLEIEFNVVGPLTQEAIRKILINSVHDFLNNINSDAQLCSFLEKGHLDISEIGIGLFFNDSGGYPIENKIDIDMASIRKGIVRYCRSDPNEISINGIEITEESYDRAIEILHSQGECAVEQKRCNDLPTESIKSDKNQ